MLAKTEKILGETAYRYAYALIYTTPFLKFAMIFFHSSTTPMP